jgi:hypothetical protein
VEKATKASILERFIKDHPFLKVTTLAKLRIAEIDFSDVKTDNPFRGNRAGNTSWTDFANFYAFTNYIPVPEDPELRETYFKKLHPLLIEALSQMNSFDVWMRYLKSYSENPYFTEAALQMEKFLLTRTDKWEGYEMLQAYLALCDERLKHPCPNRDMLIGKFHFSYARVGLNFPPEYGDLVFIGKVVRILSVTILFIYCGHMFTVNDPVFFQGIDID